MWSSSGKSSLFTVAIILPEENLASWCISAVMPLGHPARCAPKHDRAISSWVSRATHSFSWASLAAFELSLQLPSVTKYIHSHIFSRSALLSCVKFKGKGFQSKKTYLHGLEGDNEKPTQTQWDQPEFCNLMLRIPFKLGHRSKEQGI